MPNTRTSPSGFLEDATFWAELIAASGLGAVLFWAFDLKDLGQVTWIIGGLHVYHRYVLKYHFDSSIQPICGELQQYKDALLHISRILDLSANSDVRLVRSAVDKYFQITEAELAWQKNGALSELVGRLDRLLREKRSETMLTAEYYNWLLPRLAASSRGSTIWAVSRMMTCEWDESPEEVEFLRLNLEAASRGVTVRRIFLCERDVWDQALVANTPIIRQLEHGGSLQVYFGDVAAIRRRDASTLTDFGDGLIAFDGDVMLVDEHSEDGSARGYVVLAPDLISARRNRFESLRTMCALQRSQVAQTVPTNESEDKETA